MNKEKKKILKALLKTVIALIIILIIFLFIKYLPYVAMGLIILFGIFYIFMTFYEKEE